MPTISSVANPKGPPSGGARITAWLLGAMAVTVLAYLPGLDGPFLFDDPPNILIPFQAWLDGRTGWEELVLGNRSGLLGRPLSMLSFVANAVTTGLDVVPFKATNLAIHLICGGLIYLLVVKLLKRDPALGTRASTIALLVATIWLLHPIQVSTVLYVVQRMAQLSTLFILIAILAFLAGRTAAEQGDCKRSLIYLFAAFPAATLSAMLCKENGALAPLLCAVIELGYFRPTPSTRRPPQAKWFFALFLGIPALLASALLLIKPAYLIGGYEGRLFTLGERLLSQPRALFDYIHLLLLPNGPAMGLYTDDFPISRGLLDPPTTLMSMLGLLALMLIAIRIRKSMPVVFTGVGLFLAGHAMESTIFPLELYFEHRNYLPAFGLFLAVAGGISQLIGKAGAVRDNNRYGSVLKLGLGAFMMLLAFATWARANVWSSWPALADQGVTQHPESMRAHLDHISLLLAQSRNDEAEVAYRNLAKLSNPSAANVSAMGTVYLQCRLHDQTTPEEVASIGRIVGQKLQLPELMSAENLANQLMRNECDGLRKDELATILRDAADLSGQPSRLTPIWRTRFTAARLYLGAKQPRLAQEQAALAWMSGAADPAVGLFLANLYYINQDPSSARIITGDVKRRLKSWDKRNQEIIQQLQQTFENGEPK